MTKEKETISASEALFGFAAWLTSLNPSITVGATEDAALMANLVTEWIETNKLEMPREGIFPHNIKHPSTKPHLKTVS